MLNRRGLFKGVALFAAGFAGKWLTAKGVVGLWPARGKGDAGFDRRLPGGAVLLQ